MSVFAGANVDVPSGVIMPWDGKGDNVPTGWVYCDGNNGTPDLRSKYVKCVPDTNTDPGATGGSASVTLSVSELPGHTHTASFDTTGDHSHTVNTTFDANEDTSDAGNRQEWADSGFFDNKYDTLSGGDHKHSFNIEDAGEASPSSFSNNPKRRSVSYIQKL